MFSRDFIIDPFHDRLVMELIRGVHNLRPAHLGCVATIGNYDGVHLGHRAVLEQVHNLARPLGLPVTVVTFEPSPQEYFAAEGAPARLSRLPEKLAELAGAGVDRVLCLRFDRALARLSATEFVERLLIRGLGVRELVVGDDFRFGRGREGDFDLLAQIGHQAGFGVHRTRTLTVDGERVSSSRIRSCLANGDLPQARRLLGRPYSLCGRVVHGEKLGRELGFPTANLPVRRRVSPLRGIFVVQAQLSHGAAHAGVASLGTRPTVNGRETLLEVHLLEPAGNLYGRRMRVFFLKHLRDEQRFESVELMRQQIALDVQAARDYFSQPGWAE